MGKRYLDCTSSEIAKMDGKRLVEAIAEVKDASSSARRSALYVLCWEM